MQDNKKAPNAAADGAAAAAAAVSAATTAMSAPQQAPPPVMASPYKSVTPASLLPPPLPLPHGLRDTQAVVIPGRPDMPKL